jgi:hypothetical protein
MLVENSLDLNQTAYLCGGPGRAALTAILSLHQAGALSISAARHRVKSLPGDPANELERTVLATIPEVGQLLGSLREVVAQSPAMNELRTSLVERGLLHRWQVLGQTARGRRLCRQLRELPPPGLHKVAVLGAAAISDADLRRTFTTPDPAPAPMPDPHRSYGAGRTDESVLQVTTLWAGDGF